MSDNATSSNVTALPTPKPGNIPFPARELAGLGDLIAYPFLAARVTGADYNGREFDGVPLEGMHFKAEAAKIAELFDATKGTEIEARGCTDYAWFGIPDEYGNISWAGPGDYIVAIALPPADTALPPTRSAPPPRAFALTNTDIKYKLMMVPGMFFDKIFKRIENPK
jgi:hypothetical protein